MIAYKNNKLQNEVHKRIAVREEINKFRANNIEINIAQIVRNLSYLGITRNFVN